MVVLFSRLWIGASEHFHDCIIFFIMDLVNPFVYGMVFYLLARNESFHESGASGFIPKKYGESRTQWL
jgi:hypothetical protein